MVAAQNGVIQFRKRDGSIIGYSLYLDDVIGDLCTFSRNGKAGASSTNQILLDQDAWVESIVIHTPGSLTATTQVVTTVQDQPYDTMSALSLIDTNPTPKQNTVHTFIPKGAKFTMQQQ